MTASEDKRQQLMNLGAETLATTLLELADNNKDVERAVKSLISSPDEKARSFKASLSGLKRRSRFISRGQSGEFARELESMLSQLRSGVADSRAGIEAVAAFYQADKHVFENCDDSNGSVGDIFRISALDLFVFYAKECQDKSWIADLVIKLNHDDGYGVRDHLFDRAAEYLPGDELHSVVNKLWALWNVDSKKEYGSRHWLIAIESLAKQLGDPALLERAFSVGAINGELSEAAITEIAELCLQCGNAAEALSWMQRVPPGKSWQTDKRDRLLVQIHKALGQIEEATLTAWRIFRGHRCQDNLKLVLSLIGEEKRGEVVEAEAGAVLESPDIQYVDAEFLLAVGRIDDAERYLEERADKLDGGYHYPELLSFAGTLEKHGKFLVTSLLYRALLNSILERAKTKTYGHGAKYLTRLDVLANKVEDWKGTTTHEKYKAGLKLKHRLKHSFWSLYGA